MAGDLDPAIHAPARLRIMAALNALPLGDAISFPRVQALLGLTAGNLITHPRKLDESDYVTSSQSGRGRGSQTKVALTDDGRHALRNYRRALTEILGDDYEKRGPTGLPD